MVVAKAGMDHSLALVRAYTGLEAVYAGFEGAARALEAVRAAPICVDNCGRCCEINTPYCWDIEASYIISHLLSEGKLAWALDACQSWLLDRDGGLTLYGPRADTVSIEGRTRVIAEARIAARRPCPFLNSEKRCAIHEVRPLVCRAYGVTRLPSQSDCLAPLGRGENLSRRAHHDGNGLKEAVAEYLRQLRPDQRAGYFLPTAILRQASQTRFALLQDRFATGKMVAMAVSPAAIWQDQLNEQWGRT